MKLNLLVTGPAAPGGRALLDVYRPDSMAYAAGRYLADADALALGFLALLELPHAK